MSDVRERHQRVTVYDEENGPFDFCKFCDYAWPCDAIQMLDRAEAAEALADRFHDTISDFIRQRNAALADADRLAAALRDAGRCRCLQVSAHEEAACVMHVALRQHEEATR